MADEPNMLEARANVRPPVSTKPETVDAEYEIIDESPTEAADEEEDKESSPPGLSPKAKRNWGPIFGLISLLVFLGLWFIFDKGTDTSRWPALGSVAPWIVGIVILAVLVMVLKRNGWKMPFKIPGWLIVAVVLIVGLVWIKKAVVVTIREANEKAVADSVAFCDQHEFHRKCLVEFSRTDTIKPGKIYRTALVHGQRFMFWELRDGDCEKVVSWQEGANTPEGYVVMKLRADTGMAVVRRKRDWKADAYERQQNILTSCNAGKP